MNDLTGQKFGRWKVIEKSDMPSRWVCICKCGTKKDVRQHSLINGDTKSCGCLNKQVSTTKTKPYQLSNYKANNNL